MPVAVGETTLTSPAEITYINEHFTRIFGYTLDEVPTVAAWAERAYPDPVYRREVFRGWDEAVFRAIETKGRVESMEFEVTCKNGSLCSVVISAAALPDRLIVTMTDVTERRKTEADLRSLREQLERTAVIRVPEERQDIHQHERSGEAATVATEAELAQAVLSVVSAPKGTRYAVLEVQPEAPVTEGDT
jgi:PAS domain S-box-containing protein